MSQPVDERWSQTPERPVTVRGRLEEPLSRWLWLVKWLLLIPHYIVLFFLWVAFAVVTVVAFFAILFTGRYPHSLFSFNLGVLRWSWRVSYYGYSALGTDRYPPFSLGPEPGYPATLDIAYPERLSRGLVLVKWWLLAIPQYILVGIFVSGTATATTTTTRSNGTTWTTVTSAGTGLVPLLVFFAAVALLFTARYPGGIFALVLGLDRWVLRVVAYVTLMTDAYPPFRLDQGGEEPVPASGPPSAGPTSSAAEPSVPVPPAQAGPPGRPSATPPPAPSAPTSSGRTAGSVVALVAGLLALLVGIGMAGAGGFGLWLDSRRDAAGFVSTNSRLLSTPTAALTAESIDLHVGDGATGWVSSDQFGTVRVRATSTDGTPLFIGIAPQSALDTWLGPVAHDQVTNVGTDVRYTRHDGSAVLPSPTQQTFWSAAVAGTGTQQLSWRVASGRWGVVVARPSGAPGVSAQVSVGANIPDLAGVATALLVVGIVLVLGGAALVVLGAVGLGRRSGTPPPPPYRPAAPSGPTPSAPEPAVPAR